MITTVNNAPVKTEGGSKPIILIIIEHSRNNHVGYSKADIQTVYE